jgi:hypothetical protein
MTANSRQRRGADTQNLVAQTLKAAGFPYAESAGAGRNGRDVLGTPGIAVEVKARRDFSPIAWTRQAAATAGGDLPLVVMRPDGLGPAHIDEWPAILRFSDLLRLLREAGYIDEESKP